MVQAFVRHANPAFPLQIVDLGAGLDTLYFWLKTEMMLASNEPPTADGSPGRFGGRKPQDLTFFELDFPMVVNKKTKTVLKKSREPGLGAHLAARASEHTMVSFLILVVSKSFLPAMVHILIFKMFVRHI